MLCCGPPKIQDQVRFQECTKAFFRFGACPSTVGDSSVGTSSVGGFAVGFLPGSSEGASPLNWTRLAGQTIAFPRWRARNF